MGFFTQIIYVQICNTKISLQYSLIEILLNIYVCTLFHDISYVKVCTDGEYAVFLCAWLREEAQIFLYFVFSSNSCTSH